MIGAALYHGRPPVATIAPRYPIGYNSGDAERGDEQHDPPERRLGIFLTGAFGFTADEVEAVRLSLRVAF
jgi:hypothetical protein